jgi:hypothetical protein
MTMITNEVSIDRQARTRDRSSELLLRYDIDEADLQRIRSFGALASLRLSTSRGSTAGSKTNRSSLTSLPIKSDWNGSSSCS